MQIYMNTVDFCSKLPLKHTFSGSSSSTSTFLFWLTLLSEPWMTQNLDFTVFTFVYETINTFKTNQTCCISTNLIVFNHTKRQLRNSVTIALKDP